MHAVQILYFEPYNGFIIFLYLFVFCIYMGIYIVLYIIYSFYGVFFNKFFYFNFYNYSKIFFVRLCDSPKFSSAILHADS